MTATDLADRLLKLRPLILRWVGEQCARQNEYCERLKPRNRKDSLPANPAGTRAYADLTVAFGLARLGWTNAGCQRHLEEARQHLDSWDEAHAFLFRAYEFRIRQALEGQSRNMSLPAELLEELTPGSWQSTGSETHARMSKASDYVVNRLRERSEILEPNGAIDPYRAWGTRQPNNIWYTDLFQLCDIADPSLLANRIQHLMQLSADLPPSERSSILTVALQFSPRIAEPLAQDLLCRVTPLLGTLTDQLARTELLGAGFSGAAHWGNKERVREFAVGLHGLLNSQDGALLAQTYDRLLRRSIRALSQVGLREELNLLVGRLAEVLGTVENPSRSQEHHEPLAERERTQKNDRSTDWTARSRGLLEVAAGWLDLGLVEPACPVLDQVWELLRGGNLPLANKMRLCWPYARILGRIPGEEGLRRGEALFQLDGIFDTFTTNTWYALAPLKLVESLVLGMTIENSRLPSSPRG